MNPSPFVADAIARWGLRRSGRAWLGQCPFCAEPGYSCSNPFTLFDSGGYYCHACERKGRVGNEPLPTPSFHRKDYIESPPAPPLSEAGLRRAEMHPRAVAYFAGRGLRRETIVRFRLGYDGWRYTIPCYRADGILAGVKRRRDPDNATDQGPKYVSVKGSRAAIFNEAALSADEVVVAEGEVDVMTLAQDGIAAVCSTAGVAHWPDAWLPKLAGKRVTVWFDSDKPGQDGALRLARRLDGVAASVRIVADWSAKDVNAGVVL